jgi:hypothetical protein
MAKDIVARTAISGVVNGQLFKGNVLASFNTDSGGRSTCQFTQLPLEFTPGTFGTFT